jgi:hypothetical protein
MPGEGTGSSPVLATNFKMIDMELDPKELRLEDFKAAGFYRRVDEKGQPWAIMLDWCEELLIYGLDRGFFLVVKEAIFPVDNGHGFGKQLMNLCHIRYVHELQNLYFILQGSELVIETSSNTEDGKEGEYTVSNQ